MVVAYSNSDWSLYWHILTQPLRLITCSRGIILYYAKDSHAISLRSLPRIIYHSLFCGKISQAFVLCIPQRPSSHAHMLSITRLHCSCSSWPWDDGWRSLDEKPPECLMEKNHAIQCIDIMHACHLAQQHSCPCIASPALHFPEWMSWF